MRADAKKNYDRLLLVAGDVVAEHGIAASMREIARRANVGLATLLRHFPTREDLFEALLHTNLYVLTQRARELEAAHAADEALVSWFREAVVFVRSYTGVVALMASAHENPDSALYASCALMHAAGERLLLRAQSEGTARADMDGADLFALMAALGWLGGQSSFAPRADRLFDIIESAILTRRASKVVEPATDVGPKSAGSGSVREP